MPYWEPEYDQHYMAAQSGFNKREKERRRRREKFARRARKKNRERKG